MEQSVVDLQREYLKSKLSDLTTFEGHETEWKDIRDLLYRTFDAGESNSALLIGPRGSGKTMVKKY